MLQRFVSSKWAWDHVLGPFYVRTIERAAADIYREVIERIGPVDQLDVLDVGCGPAFVTLELASRYPRARFTGVDYSKTLIKFATEQAKRRELEHVDFRQANAMSLPFADAAFDFAFSIASIKYWPDASGGLAEIRRVLRPGGRALIVEADRDAPANEIESFVASHLRWRWWRPLMERGFRRMGYSRAAAESTAIQAGFDKATVAKMEGHPFIVVELVKEAT